MPQRKKTRRAAPRREPDKGQDRPRSERRPRPASRPQPPRREQPQARQRPQSQEAPARGAAVEAVVAPLTLGQDGLVARTPRRQYQISAGVLGERVLLQPDRDGETAQLRKVIEASPDRCPAPCPLLWRCGACSLQAMRYPAQVSAKTNALRQALATLACPAELVADVRPQPSPFGYRTKLLMPADGERGALRFGFYRRGSRHLVPAEGCPVQHPRTLAVLAGLRQLLDAHLVSPSTVRGGWLHAVAIRCDPSADQTCELTLAGRTTRPPGGDRLADQISALPGVCAVHLTAQPERSSYPLGPKFKPLAGRRRMTHHVGGEAISLSPGSFFQSSAAGAELLAEEVLALMPDDPDQIGTLADLYGGAGTFTRLSAGRWRKAVVVEESGSAIADLRHHLRGAPYGEDVTPVAGRVEDKAKEVFTSRTPGVALLDPPRRGCKPPVLAAICEHRPRQVIYIACGFDSLLRDAAVLLEAGYRWHAVRAVDMFPHTSHVETIASFTLD